MSAQLPPDVQELSVRVKQLEEQLKLIVARRQQVKVEMIDVENAISELEKIDENTPVYKAVGTIMVKRDRDALLKELRDRKETLELQEMTLGKQESVLRKQWEKALKELNELLIKYGLVKPSGS